ncbi:hypothetical protein Lesp01_42060 [Lentzea sp. NBRC 102530]|nr:hypothetical protein Lesp01_42060 [Lentzea sp. NBRC 102530]
MPGKADEFRELSDVFDTRAHGEALDLAPRPEGGLRVTIRLPSA